MRCLNCGNNLSGHDANCPHCNIPVKSYGVIHNDLSRTQPESTLPCEEDHCENCHSVLTPHSTQCIHCNFPRKRKPEILAEPTPTAYINPAGQTAPADTGIVWNMNRETALNGRDRPPFQSNFGPGLQVAYARLSFR